MLDPNARERTIRPHNPGRPRFSISKTLSFHMPSPAKMSKYAALARYLNRVYRGRPVNLDFTEIEKALGFELPRSARAHRAWWANETRGSHSHARYGWISAGFWKTADPVIPADSGEIYAALARQLRQTPVWIFHGEVDPVVPVDESRKAFAALQTASSQTQYSEVPGTGHNSWDPAYASPKFWTWLFAQRRDQ